MSPIVGLLLLAGCLLLQGFFSGSEIAMVSANRMQLETAANEGQTSSALALRLLQREETLIGTCLIGTNLSVVTGTTLVAWMLRSNGVQGEVFWSLGFIPFALILGEALPKTVYQHHADVLAPILAWPIRGIQLAFTPLLWLVMGWTQLLRRVTGDPVQVEVTREEILMLLEDPDIDPAEGRMIRRVFEIGETRVSEVMTPLVQVRAVPTEATVDEAIAVAVRSGHSRLPVYERRVDNMVGILHAQDLLDDLPHDTAVASLMHPIRYVPESQRVDSLLNDMRSSPEHLAVVVDEYGGSVGLITVEDLLEEIVGEIHDERDAEPPGIHRVDTHTWNMRGSVEIEDVEDLVGFALPEGRYETVAGLVLWHLGHIPVPGEVMRLDNLTLTVEEADARKVHLVTLHVTSGASALTAHHTGER